EKDLPLALSADLSRHVQAGQEREVDDLDEFIDDLGLPDFLQNIAHEVATNGNVRHFAQNVRRGFKPPQQARVEQPNPAPEQPAQQPPAKSPTSRAEDLRGRALGNLDLLMSSVNSLGDTLPKPAQGDLERTTRELRKRAVELSHMAVGLEAALDATPESEDVSWVHGRLTRMETMERTGETVDTTERHRLQAALESAEAASNARDDLESQLTSILAQLLELSAIATRTHTELHAETNLPHTARLFKEQLQQQVDAVDATRREMGRRAAQTRR
ncbi:MAG: hypothetical protein HN348_31375, partial [Proteobacteria bacterium]|nr:hypothetical protein [Pseudomonadota bacterium]